MTSLIYDLKVDSHHFENQKWIFAEKMVAWEALGAARQPISLIQWFYVCVCSKKETFERKNDSIVTPPSPTTSFIANTEWTVNPVAPDIHFRFTFTWFPKSRIAYWMNNNTGIERRRAPSSVWPNYDRHWDASSLSDSWWFYVEHQKWNCGSADQNIGLELMESVWARRSRFQIECGRRSRNRGNPTMNQQERTSCFAIWNLVQSQGKLWRLVELGRSGYIDEKETRVERSRVDEWTKAAQVPCFL